MEENPLMNFEIIKNIPVKHIIYLVVFSQYCSKNKIQSKYLEKKNGTNFSFKKKTNTCKIKVLYSQQPRTHILDISVFSKKSHLLQNHKPDAAATLLKITKKQ